MAAKPVRIAIIANAAQAKKELASMSKETSSLGARLGKFGKIAAAGFAVAAVGAVKLGSSVVSSASDAQQSMGATETVFGKYADKVIADSKRAATAIGVSANEYRELSNVTGALLSGAGMPLKKVAGLTDDLNRRAADLAATFGGKTADAVGAISSLMKGEADPIERYGISIKQSDVNARMAAEGTDKLTGAAKKQAEMQARVNLLMEKSAKTSGAFKKESNTLAHQQQVLSAQWEDMKARLGAGLLPIITKVLTTINRNFVPAFEKAGAILGPIASSIKSFFTEGGKGASTLQPVVDFVRTKLLPAFAGIHTALQGAWAAIQPILTQVAAAFMAKWQEIAPAVQSIFASIQTVVLSAMGIIQRIIEITTGLVKVIWDRWGGHILSFVTTSFGNVVTIISGVFQVISGIFTTVLSVLKGDWKGAWTGIKQILSGVWKAIKGIVLQALNVVVASVKIAWAGVKAATALVWKGLKATVTGAIGAVVDVVRGTKDKVTSIFSGSLDWLKSAGQDILNGLSAGIDAGWEAVKSKVEGLANKIPGWLKKPLGIASPSKVMRRLAKWIPAGIAKGIDDGAAGVKKSMSTVYKNLTGDWAKDKVAAAAKQAEKAGKKAKDVAKVKALAEKTVEAASRKAWKTTAALRVEIGKKAKAYAKVRDQVKAAKAALTALKEERSAYAASVKDGVVSYGAVTGLNSAFNAPEMIAQMRDRLGKAQDFARVMKELIAAGLNTTTVNDLTQAGVEGGLAYATALAQGGPSAIAEVNSLTASLAATGQALGTSTSSHLFDAGVQSAQGLVKGLKSQSAALEKSIAGLSKKMVKALKKALGIKSPSRVFKALGAHTIQGMQIGLEDTKGVQKAMTNLSGLMTNSYTPELESAARALDTKSSTVGGGDTINVTVNVPPGADKAAVGRELVDAIDAYYKKGGRRL